MELFTWLSLVLVASFNVVGLIEWVKSIRDIIINIKNKTGKKSTIMWPILSLGFSCLLGFALGKSDFFAEGSNSFIFTTLTILSFCEIIGYNVIVKMMFFLVDKAIYGEGGKTKVPKKE